MRFSERATTESEGSDGCKGSLWQRGQQWVRVVGDDECEGGGAGHNNAYLRVPVMAVRTPLHRDQIFELLHPLRSDICP